MQIKRDMNYIETKFKEQLKLLKKRIVDYEKGDQIEAYQIASILRVLLHDTKRSTSILRHLKIKDKVMFQSLASPYSTLNIAPYLGLLSLRITSGYGLEYVGNCKSKNQEQIFKREIFYRFEDWWNEIVIDDKKEVYTRRDLVLHVANKEGGSHLDIKVDININELMNKNSIGWKYSQKDLNSNLKIESDPVNNPVLETIYVIANEFIESINQFQLFHKKRSNIYEKKLEGTYSYMIFNGNKKAFLLFNKMNDWAEKEIRNENFTVTERCLYSQKIVSDSHILTRVVLK